VVEDVRNIIIPTDPRERRAREARPFSPASDNFDTSTAGAPRHSVRRFVWSAPCYPPQRT